MMRYSKKLTLGVSKSLTTSAAACRERVDEAALFAAVSVGANVTVGAPTMA
jgi:hypothetical protein